MRKEQGNDHFRRDAGASEQPAPSAAFRWPRRLLLGAVLGATLTAGTAAVAAERFPSQPVTWIVPYAAGGGSDVIARLVASGMAKELGTDIIVENRPGAGTAIGAQAVARAEPNGYTVGTADSGTLAFNPSLYSQLSYDPKTSFTYVGGLARIPLVLVTRPGLGVSSVQELVELVKANPGKISYASAGAGSPHHIAMEMFAQQTGAAMNHIPYKGAAPAILDILGDRVDVMMIDMVGGVAHIQGGKVKALGVAMEDRFPGLPNVPTLNQGGLNDFIAYAWQGVVAPAGLPADRLQVLDGALRGALGQEAVLKRFGELGIEAMPMSSAEFRQLMDTESERWSKIIREAGIKLD